MLWWEMPALPQHDRPLGLSAGNPQGLQQDGLGLGDAEMLVGKVDPVLETGLGARLQRGLKLSREAQLWLHL